jgi:hypothetical protein
MSLNRFKTAPVALCPDAAAASLPLTPSRT